MGTTGRRLIMSNQLSAGRVAMWVVKDRRFAIDRFGQLQCPRNLVIAQRRVHAMDTSTIETENEENRTRDGRDDADPSADGEPWHRPVGGEGPEDDQCGGDDRECDPHKKNTVGLTAVSLLAIVRTDRRATLRNHPAHPLRSRRSLRDWTFGTPAYPLRDGRLPTTVAGVGVTD